MNEPLITLAIGSVLRADIRGFVIASRIPEPAVPTFGTFVRAPIQHSQAEVIGLVYDIRLQDDPFLKNLAVTVMDESTAEFREVIRDQQENRVIPVEISVVAIGYQQIQERCTALYLWISTTTPDDTSPYQRMLRGRGPPFHQTSGLYAGAPGELRYIPRMN